MAGGGRVGLSLSVFAVYLMAAETTPPFALILDLSSHRQPSEKSAFSANVSARPQKAGGGERVTVLVPVALAGRRRADADRQAAPGGAQEARAGHEGPEGGAYCTA